MRFPQLLIAALLLFAPLAQADTPQDKVLLPVGKGCRTGGCCLPNLQPLPSRPLMPYRFVGQLTLRMPDSNGRFGNIAIGNVIEDTDTGERYIIHDARWAITPLGSSAKVEPAK